MREWLLRRVRVEDDYMALLEVVDESMEVGEVEPTAGVVAAQLILALKHGERVHDRATVTLDGGGHLAELDVVGAGMEEVSRSLYACDLRSSPSPNRIPNHTTNQTWTSNVYIA